MFKPSKVIAITAVAIALSLSVNSFASAKDSAGFKVAVVDIQKIVVNSPQINALKTEQKNKISDMISFVEKAKSDLAKESDATKKKSLEEGYNKELNVKKDAIDREYARKLSAIDKSIDDVIKSKSADYDLVLIKSSVLKGGVDITSEVIKALK